MCLFSNIQLGLYCRQFNQSSLFTHWWFGCYTLQRACGSSVVGSVVMGALLRRFTTNEPPNEQTNKPRKQKEVEQPASQPATRTNERSTNQPTNKPTNQTSKPNVLTGTVVPLVIHLIGCAHVWCAWLVGSLPATERTSERERERANNKQTSERRANSTSE